MKTGIFLTPGAARTAYYVGALHTLMTESDIRFDVIAGTSVGALNGAYAAMEDTEQLVEIWREWTTREVMVNDYGAIIKGAFFWAKNFASNEPEYETGVRDFIFEEKLREGVTFRFNIADLTSGENRILEYPGESIPLQKAIMAAVSVPVLFEPVEIEGHQYADGLAIEGCPLNEILLGTGVERLFVLGVSPREPLLNPAKNTYRTLLSAVEWNQYSEPLLAMDAVREANGIITSWQEIRKEIGASLDGADIDDSKREDIQSSIAELYDSIEFPYARDPVEIIPVMPEKPIDMWFGEFEPERSQRLMELGRQRALDIMKNL